MSGAEMMTSLCREVRNYFVRSDSDKISGVFSVREGGIALSADAAGASQDDFRIADGQFFRIVGSLYNDGVWQNSEAMMTNLREEEFTGQVWLMAPPKDFLDLAEEIAVWIARFGDAALSPYASESFGGYSYTLRGTSRRNESARDNEDASWQTAFRRRLAAYRRIMV